MSFYARLEGCIKYNSEDALNEILETLTDGGWMNDDHIWLTETDDPKYSHPNPTVNFETNTLRIPRASYRNLTRLESQFLEAADIATIVGSSMDGNFIGWVTTEQDNWEVDLRSWARTRGHHILSIENSQTAQVEWQQDVMTEWHDMHDDYPRFN